MIHFHFQTPAETDNILAKRKGESKLGEHLKYSLSLESIAESEAQFVVFGIKEDIGVQANYGVPGATKAWDCFVQSFVNIQQNKHNDGNTVLLLGHIAVTPHQKVTSKTPRVDLGDIVARIDKMVASVVQAIVKAGKIPIIIGGGHNNAYGNLKGSSQALGYPINAINIDAHTDLRTTDYRHSGNGFSYAMQTSPETYLKKYAVFGLQKNYTPEYIYQHMDSLPEKIHYTNYENTTQEQFQDAVSFVSDTAFGLELDVDAIANFPSSAQSPSGFSIEAIRSYIMRIGQATNCCYFHICEAAPKKKTAGQVGKALSYFVSDFIRYRHGNSSL